MATSETRWKKLPVGIIRDEDLDYIADQIAPELRAAPYMFYMTALCKSDNDGIFDLEDGVIFSRLMRIGTPQDVFTIANLMIKRRIILRAGETTRCIIANWEYPEKVPPRTLDDRRAIVAKQIESEKRNAQIAEFTVRDADPIAVDFNNNAASNINFFCGLNDKNAKNVTINNFDDKNEKNVVEKNQTEREIERKIERHTQEKKDKIDQKQGLQLPEGFRPCQNQNKQISENNQKAEPEKDQWENQQQPATAGMEQSGSMGKGISEEERQAVIELVAGFFTKNYLGFNPYAEREAIWSVADRMIWLSDSKNPPEIVTSVFLGQFKKLVEEDGYYKGAPLTPMQLIKPGTYSHVLALASKILLNKNNNQRWQEQQQALQAEIEREKNNVCDGVDAEYLKYHISPQDPNRSQKLLIAKASEQRETEPP